MTAKSRNGRKTARLGGFTALILVLAILLYPSFCSAQLALSSKELVKSGKYGTIMLKDISNQVTQEVKLVDNTDYCNQNCYAVKEIKLYSSAPLIQDVRFYRVDGGRKELVDLPYSFLVKTGDKTIDEYGIVCKDLEEINKTDGKVLQDCSEQKIGSHTEEQWSEYKKGEVYLAGTYKIKLVATKKWYEDIDWQIKEKDLWLSEWYVWKSDIITGTTKDIIDVPYDWDRAVFWEGQSTTNATQTSEAPYFINYTILSSYNGTINNVSFFGHDINPYTAGMTVNFFYTDGTMGSNAVTVNLQDTTYANYNATNPSKEKPVWKIQFQPTGANPDTAYLKDVFFTIYNISEGKVVLNSPLNSVQSQAYSTVGFNCSAQTTDRQLANISLWTSDGGSWNLKNITAVTGLSNNTVLTRTFSVFETPVLWTCMACVNDSCAFAFEGNRTLNFVPFGEAGLTYKNPAYETELVYFNSNITYVNSLWSSIFAYLNFNNTDYYSTKSVISDSNVSFSNYVNMPLSSVPVNKSFYWKIGLINNTGTYYFNTTITNLTVLPLPFLNFTTTTCPTGLFNVISYYLFDENNNSIVNATSIKYNFQYSGGKTSYGMVNFSEVLKVCMNTTTNYITTLGYGEIDYYSTNYVQRNYYLFNGTMLNSSVNTNISAYDLFNGLSQSFSLTIRDTGYNAAENKYVALLRWYPQYNEYRVVEMVKTDENGQSVIKVEPEDADYRLAVYELNGTLIYLANPTKMVCLSSPCSYTLYIPLQDVDYYSIFDVTQSLTFNETARKFTYIWSDSGLTTQMIRFNVYRENGNQITQICNYNSSSFVGVLTCSFGNESGIYTAKVYRTSSGTENTIATLSESLFSTASSANIKYMGLFFTFMLLIIAAIMMIYNPIAAVLIAVVSFIPALLFGAISFPIFMAVVVMGLVIIYVLTRM